MDLVDSRVSWPRLAHTFAGALLGLTAARLTDFFLTVRRAHRYSERAVRFERRLESPRCRVLILGDSTAVGLGSASVEASVAGRLAREFPDASVENHAEVGARVANVIDQLAAASGRFDAVLIAVGGNDVIRGTPESRVRSGLDTVLVRAREMSRFVIVANSANVGNAPLFGWPFNLLLTRRSLRLRRLFAQVCRQHRVRFVNFTYRGHRDEFARLRDEYFAEDGLHPNADAYGYCYMVLKRRSALIRVLAGG
jgi:lysophospholipase L1-like esterase